MEVQVLSYCDARDVSSIASNSLFELNRKDWSDDAFLMEVITRLKKANELLTTAIGRVRKGRYTAKLAEADALFDQDFVCLRTLVEANTRMRDAELVGTAERVLHIIEANNKNLHRLGYEKQIVSAKSMLAAFDREEVREIISTMVGVPLCIDYLKESVANMEVLYQKSRAAAADRQNRVVPSAQKNPVREIINKDLLPYLHVMARIKPDEYGQLVRIVVEYVESVNAKARTRRRRSS